jgi:Glycosyl hydrolases family 2, sugar binding domain
LSIWCTREILSARLGHEGGAGWRRACGLCFAACPEKQIASLEGPWKVDFQPGRGAPASITLQTLGSWSESSDAGVRYFSGTATYHKTFEVPAEWISGPARMLLDLGDVKNLAEVSVNGHSLGIVWHAPYRVEVTSGLKSGTNEVAISVTNAWVNRLIGDQQPDATMKYAVTDVTPYSANSPLQPSGLLAPVVVIQSPVAR